ncbi:MAG: SpoIIIAH-like family protein [Bacilli bacterium]|nr:SpoIIIAH-like family protein [Bacilli bacterium]
MNKQLVSFLSLFSLVLVLSIYYVMLPFSGSNLGDNSNNLPVINEIEDATDAYFVSLELQKSETYKELISEQNDILASSNATIEEKQNALEEIARIEEVMAKEANTVAMIIEAGYPAAYVENYEQGVKVVVYKEDATKTDAATVMALVIEEFGLELMPEVSFYS